MGFFSYQEPFNMYHTRTWIVTSLMGSDYPFVKSLLYLIPQSVQLSLRKVYIVSSSLMLVGHGDLGFDFISFGPIVHPFFRFSRCENSPLYIGNVSSGS